MLIGIPKRIKEKKRKKEEEQRRLNFQEKVKPFILADKFCDNHIMELNYDNDIVIKTINEYRNNLKENKDLYAYNKLTLDEQYEYLVKTPALLIESIKKTCKLLRDDINNGKTNEFKYYCNEDEFKDYLDNKLGALQKIIDYNITDEYEDLKKIKIEFIAFMLDHLYMNELFWNSYIGIYNLQLGFFTDAANPYFSEKNYNTHFPHRASDEECEEFCDNLELEEKSFEYHFLLNNLNSKYFKELKNAINDNSLIIDNNVFRISNKDWGGYKGYIDNTEPFYMLFIYNLFIHYLFYNNKSLLIDYCKEIWKIEDLYNNLFEELDKDRGIIFSGVAGEKMVEEEFNIYKDELEYFSNIRLEDDGLSVETDGLIVSERGIFSIEIKNYKFQKLKISKDGRWTKCYGDNEEVINDVGSQMNRHIIIAERLFNKHLKDAGIKEKIEIKPMIIFANNDIEIENNSDMVVVRASQIYNNFKKSDCNYSKKTISEIKKYIKNNKLPAKKYEIINYEKTFENITNSLLENRNKDIELFNEILRVLNEDLPKELENELDS